VKDLINILKTRDCEVVSGFAMSSYTAMRVGGNARFVIYPQTVAALSGALEILSSGSVPFVVLGAGSNTIVGDDGIEGAIVSTCRLKSFEITDRAVVADCGVPLSALMNGTARRALSGLEFAAGIPGTVGGAVFMNAGANNGEIAEVVGRVVIWQDGRERTVCSDEMDWGYRKGGLPAGSVLLQARLRLVRGSCPDIRAVIKKSLRRRKMTQPVNEANTGSIFKNPPTIAAGRLLEELGMKSFSVGTAEFSDVHANFIVNKGGAKASDVLKLISIARKKALGERGIDLETEVCVI